MSAWNTKIQAQSFIAFCLNVEVRPVVEFLCADAEQLPEADMVMGFQNYSSLPRHLRGMLGLSPELDSATYSGSSRTQVCSVTVLEAAITDATLLFKHVDHSIHAVQDYVGVAPCTTSEVYCCMYSVTNTYLQPSPRPVS